MTKLEKEGIVLVDKPSGISSHSVVNWMRKAVNVKRIGHTGTLDPLATGLLILLVGRKYTKMQDQFLKQDKEYICTGVLGLETDTYDINGATVSKIDWNDVKRITKEFLLESLLQFRGEISQTVPFFSAVKVGGRKLYELARKGEQNLITKLPIRNVVIKELELIDFSIDDNSKKATFSLRVFCSSGTYIRSLVHDIGQSLEVGATVSVLRRTKIGDIKIEDALFCPIFEFMLKK